MKVLHLLEAMGGSTHVWGKERVVQWLMDAQRASGRVEPELVTFVPTRLTELAREAGFSARVLGAEHSALPLSAMRALIAMLHASPGTVVHTHGYKANIVGRLARLQGAPIRGLVATSHGFDSYAAKLAVYNAADRVSAVVSDVATVTDPRMAEKFPPWSKPRYVANALPEAPVPAPVVGVAGRARFGWRDDEFVLGMLHRLIPQKGVDVFITAAELCARWERPDVVFAIAGDGPQRELVESAAARLPNVRYVGYIDPPDEYLAALNCFVQPSRSEGLSLALLQAMRARKTLIATRVGATELTVRDGHEGMLIEPEDPAAIAAAAVRLADDRAYAARLGDAARARFELDFRIERQERDFYALYEAAVARRSPQRTS